MKIKIHISHIYSSAKHHYFTREKFDIGNAITIEHEGVFLEPGRGIQGDRFEDSRYPLTFVSEEVMKDVFSKLKLEYNPRLFRRNIVIKGMNLNQLIGKTFEIDGLVFEGLEHCSPCTWMNAVMKKGAYKLMIGRGGLRVKVLQEGWIKTGANTLITQGKFELLDPLEAKQRPRLP